MLSQQRWGKSGFLNPLGICGTDQPLCGFESPNSMGRSGGSRPDVGQWCPRYGPKANTSVLAQASRNFHGQHQTFTYLYKRHTYVCICEVTVSSQNILERKGDMQIPSSSQPTGTGGPSSAGDEHVQCI